MVLQNCVPVPLLIGRGFRHGGSMKFHGNDCVEALYGGTTTETERDGSVGLSPWFPIILLRSVRGEELSHHTRAI